MKNDNELSLKLDRARWFIIQHSPFYGSLMMALTDILGNPHGKTACTNGRVIYWDHEFLGKLSEEETRYVLLHETLHCAHGHLWRFPAGAVDHKTGNMACDHAINLTLNGSGLKLTMPAGGLADSQFSGMSEEEIYNVLSQKPKEEQKPGDDSQDGSQGGKDGNPGDSCGDYCAPDSQPSTSTKPGDDAQQLRQDWDRKLIQAAMAAKASGQGNVPGDMTRQLAKLAAVQIDWRQETTDFVKSAIATRNDWTRGNRRHLWQSVVYPSRRRDNFGLIIGVRDTSGSIDDATAAAFSAILAAACSELGAELLLLDCDTDIAAEYRISPGEDVPLKAAGGGGTDFAAPFIRAQKAIDDGETVAGLIYLTDLIGDGWPLELPCPALCICTTSRQAPSGRTVQVMD